MKRFIAIIPIIIFWSCLSWAMPPLLPDVTEVDGSPVCAYAGVIKMPAGTVTCDAEGASINLGALGGGDVTKVANPSNHQWPYWTGDGTLGAVTMGTASKPVCTDANKDPATCAGTETVSFASVDATGAAGFTSGVAGSVQGNLKLYSNTGGNNFYFSLYGANFTENTGWRAPASNPTANDSALVVATNLNTSYIPSGVEAGNICRLPADPGAHTLFGFDNTTNTYKNFTIGTGLSFDQASSTLSSTGGGYTNLTSFVDQTAWRVFYSDGSGDVKELALGADGTYLKSNGATSAPTFDTPAGGAHTQNTDTGTTSATFQIDSGNTGPKLKNESLTLSAKVAADDAYAPVKALTVQSTVATGTAPLTVASTTNVANLNASSLNGATFAAPGAIGGTTPAAITGTTITGSSFVSSAADNTHFALPYNTISNPTCNAGTKGAIATVGSVSVQQMCNGSAWEGGLSVGNLDAGPGYIKFYEDTDNGSNSVQLIGPSSTADVVVTLPNATGTLALTSGNVATATNATNTGITNDDATDAVMYPTWVTANTGNLPQKVSSTKMTWNPSTGKLKVPILEMDSLVSTAADGSRLIDVYNPTVTPTCNAGAIGKVAAVSGTVPRTGTCDGTSAFQYHAYLDDTKGDGDLLWTWSANKIFDQLALKAPLASPTFNAVNAAGGSATAITASGTLGIMDGSDTFRGLYLNYTGADHTGTGNTIAFIDINFSAPNGDANSNLYGLRIGAITGQAPGSGEVERAIEIGAGWDHGIYSASPIATTSTLSGGSLTPVIDDPDNFAANFTGENLYGGTFIANAAGTAALPNAGAGMNFTIVLEGANAVVIEPLATGTDDTIVLNGTALTQGHNITSSTGGALCVFQYRAANSWMATCNGFVDGT